MLVERLGNETIVDLSLASGEGWLASIDGDADVEVDAKLRLGFAPDKARLFDQGGNAVRG